jgi:diguanylate cyclase (GGDEF)-like protein
MARQQMDGHLEFDRFYAEAYNLRKILSGKGLMATAKKKKSGRKPAAKTGSKRGRPRKKAPSVDELILSGTAKTSKFTSTVNRFSVVVKIALFSVVLYQLSVFGYLLFKKVFDYELSAEIFGMPASWASVLAQVFILAISATLATKIFLVNPLNRIKETIHEVSRGDFLARAEFDSGDEIGELADRFNDMLSKLTELNTDKSYAEYELLLARKELKYKESLEKRGKALKRVNTALETLVKDFALLYEIGQRVNSVIEMSELYNVLQEVLPKQLDLQRFAILLVDEKKEFLNITAAHGFDDPERLQNISFRIGEGISGEVAFTGEHIYLPNVKDDTRFLHYRGESVEEGSFLSVPLKHKNEVLGVMNCNRPSENDFSEEDIRMLTLVANQIALAVENAQLYTKTRELAVRDELTGLYNRRHFQQVMQMEWKRTTRFRRPLCVLMIDIDHFKKFNDTYGHPHGDTVLKLIADILTKNLREVDTLARFGGEEFIVLLPDTDRDGALVVGEKLRHLIDVERFDEGKVEIMPLTISTGISVFPDDAKEMDDLIDHADVALYDAKDGGRNSVVVYGGAAKITGNFSRPTLVRN